MSKYLFTVGVACKSACALAAAKAACVKTSTVYCRSSRIVCCWHLLAQTRSVCRVRYRVQGAGVRGASPAKGPAEAAGSWRRHLPCGRSRRWHTYWPYRSWAPLRYHGHHPHLALSWHVPAVRGLVQVSIPCSMRHVGLPYCTRSPSSWSDAAPGQMHPSTPCTSLTPCELPFRDV